MYDVKQFDPAEWSSPPTKRGSWTKPPLGKVMVGRGAVNQKGPGGGVSSCACMQFAAPARKMPVNLVLVAEGEEEIGRRTFRNSLGDPRVLDALKKCVGVFMPHATQDP
jgi:hypothetical protein